MTTMDSDSESQDSDEGRRFRFEATRKISSDSIHDRGRKQDSFRSHDHDRRSRSRDRSSRHERSSNERIRREGTSSRDDTRSSKDRKTLLKDEPRRRDDEFTRHRDRDLKYIHKESRDCLLRRDSRSRDRRGSKSRDDKQLAPRRKSREKSYDKIRHDFKCRDRRERHYSRERSCQRERSRDDNYPTMVDNINKVEVTTATTTTTTDGQDCKDLNLSDFDIVSDTDGDSDTLDGQNDFSDSKSNRRMCDETRISALDGREEKVKNRRNGDKSSRASNSNNDAHALSDLLLGNASTSAPTTCSFDNKNNNANEQKYIKKYCTKLDDNIGNNENNDDNVKYNEKIDSDISDEDNGDVFSYGPILPPSQNDKSEKKIDKESIELKIIGPSLPSEYRKYISLNSGDDEVEINEDEEDTFGPALPPHLQSVKNVDHVKIMGPLLPNKSKDDDNDDKMDVENILDDEIDDFDAIGPLPFDHPGIKSDRIQQQLEYRAKLIKEELAEIDNCEDKKREEWMTELPAVQTANLGLTSRKFRSRPGPDMSDRSGWTDTPMDRARKQRELELGKRPRDHGHEPEVRVEKSHSRHGKSLLELHQKKMNKKKKKEEKAAKEIGKPVRRPFDRDVDLKANHFDEARKKRIMMKAATLDDRFSRGKI